MKDFFTNRTYQLIAAGGIIFGIGVFSFIASDSDSDEVVVTSEAISSDIESTNKDSKTETVTEDNTINPVTTTEE